MDSQHPYPLPDPDAGLGGDLLGAGVGERHHLHLAAQRVHYFAIIIDLFSRSTLGWKLKCSLDQKLALNALRQALANHVLLVHHSD